MATWWLETKPKPDGPLFLEIGFPGPHPPYDPVPRYVEPYMARDLPIAEVTEGDLGGQPGVFEAMREHNAEVDHDSIVHLLDPTPAQRKRQRAYYLANVTMIDEQVGRMLETLDARGYLDNAVVIFTSDHGDCLGDHGHSQKWTMYDIDHAGAGDCVGTGQVRRWAGTRRAVSDDGSGPDNPGSGGRATA